MTDLMAIAAKCSKPIYNFVKVVGPFILSQSSRAVENFENFKLNKERLEALSIFIKAEAENLASERSKLRSNILALSGLERVKAQNEYDLLTKEINRLTTLSGVKDFIKDDGKFDSQDIKADEVDEGWVERFNQLASSLNEPWRKKLIAKAFALELQNPGTINMLTLNSIAAFDEETFRIFGCLLNLSSRLYEVSCLPRNITTEIVSLNGVELSINEMLYKLSHLNLFDQRVGVYFSVRHGKSTYLRYGQRVLDLRHDNQNGESRIDALLTTQLGNKLSLLYERDMCEQGVRYFEMFLSQARTLGVFQREIILSDFDYQQLGN